MSDEKKQECTQPPKSLAERAMDRFRSIRRGETQLLDPDPVRSAVLDFLFEFGPENEAGAADMAKALGTVIEVARLGVRPAPDKTTRCTDCAAEFTEAELAGVAGCPGCGTKSVPCAIDEDVSLRINWHELRILTIWASNYAEKLTAQSRSTLTSILRRLNQQRPPKAAALTLMGEVRELQNAGIDAELVKGDGTVIVPRKDPAS